MLLVFIAVAVLCGCKNANQEKKITALEQRVKQLEEHVEVWSEGLSGLQTNTIQSLMLAESQQTNFDAMGTRMLEQALRIDDISATVDRLAVMFTNKRPPQVVYVPQPAARQSATPGGIPADVMREITAEAVRRYPTDFEMQEFVIRKQTESYRHLHP